MRYQVLDVDGVVREKLEWPLGLPDAFQGKEVRHGETDALFSGLLNSGRLAELKLKGRTATMAMATGQTNFSAFSPGSIATFWLGLRGTKQTLTVIVHREPGRSPSYWPGPDLTASEAYNIHVAFVPDMGPGGVLYRYHNDPQWSSFVATTATGLERLNWPTRWSVGHGQSGVGDRPFLGSSLSVEISVR